MPHRRTRRYFIASVIAVICLSLAAGAWMLLRGSAAPNAAAPTSEDVIVPAPDAAPTVQDGVAVTGPLKPARAAPAGYIEYRNEHYRFALFYPDDLKAKEFDEGKGTMTVTFQDIATAQGFQIFIVPYSAPQVSEARFKQDEPSGVRQGSRSVTIDGARGVSFYSTNVALGDTAEIWFIQGGYLFEVTSLKPLAGWLSNILSSWQFL